MALRELCADDGGLVVRGAVGGPPVPAFAPPGRRRLLLQEARVDGLDVARQVRVGRAVLGRASPVLVLGRAAGASACAVASAQTQVLRASCCTCVAL